MRQLWAVVASAALCFNWATHAVPNPPPKTVYRLDSRDPARLRAEGGFSPPEPSMDDANHLSLWKHVHGTGVIGQNRKQSAYVFTSATQRGAEELARPGRRYHLYRIRATPNFISARDTLGEDHVEFLSAMTEYDALQGIRWDQVEGWTVLPAGRDTPAKQRVFRKNPDFDAKRYRSARAGAGEPRLAGFPDGHAAWDKEPWKAFKGASLPQSALDFMNANGHMVGWQGHAPLHPNTGAYGTGNSIFYVDSLNPDIQLGTFADEKPSGSAAQQRPGENRVRNKLCRRRQGRNCPPGSAEWEKTGPADEENEIPREKATAGSSEVGHPRVAEPGAVPERIPETPVEVLHPKLIAGLGYVQAAQLLTLVVDSAVARIQAARSEADHGALSSALTQTGKILAGIANDTVPGLRDIEEEVARMQKDLLSVRGRSSSDVALQVQQAVQKHESRVRLIVFENYVPGAAEVMSNARKELAEFGQSHAAETSVQKAERIAKLVSKGAANTLDDVLRDWVPGYKEAEDSARQEAKTLPEELLRLDKDPAAFLQYLEKGLLGPTSVATKTLHRVLQDYIPGEKQVEALIFGSGERGKAAAPAWNSEPAATEEVAPSDAKPPTNLSKMGREEWNSFVGNALDKEKAAECARARMGAREGKEAGSWAADAGKARLPGLTKQCYEEQFFDWLGKPRRVGRAS